MCTVCKNCYMISSTFGIACNNGGQLPNFGSTAAHGKFIWSATHLKK